MRKKTKDRITKVVNEFATSVFEDIDIPLEQKVGIMEKARDAIKQSIYLVINPATSKIGWWAFGVGLLIGGSVVEIAFHMFYN